MASSASESASVAFKSVMGAPTRAVLNVLRQKGRLTRPQIFELVPREVIPNKTRLRNILQTLVAQKRVKPFLPVGSIYGKDPFTYKLNPTRAKVNFPDLFGTRAHKRHLEHMLSKDEEGLLKELVEKTPEADNAAQKRLRQKIREAKRLL